MVESCCCAVPVWYRYVHMVKRGKGLQVTKKVGRRPEKGIERYICQYKWRIETYTYVICMFIDILRI